MVRNRSLPMAESQSTSAGQMPAIRVIVADDHPIVRDGIQAVLASDPQMHIVGVATRFDDLLTVLATESADVLVLDLGGMGGAPLSLVTRLQRDYPHLAIVVFSSSVDLAPELLQAGVRGYVVKRHHQDL